MKAFVEPLIYGFASILLLAQQGKQSFEIVLSLTKLVDWIGLANAAVVTLHVVQESRTAVQSLWSMEQHGTTTVSAIGPGESGRTRYEVKEIQSRLVVHNPQKSAAHTLLDSPITLTCKYSSYSMFQSCWIGS